MGDQIAPIHPREILMEEFLQPLGVAQDRLTMSIDIPPRRISEIVRETRRTTTDMALRLGHFLGTGARLRVDLQSHYNLGVKLDALGDELIKIQPLHST